jgi:uncharacterized phage protein (TIGR01671 family)
MKKLKFRAWIDSIKKWADSVTVYNDGSWFAQIGFSVGFDEKDGGALMQFTGLKDKNGKDIYEGDIVVMHTEWSGGYQSEDFGEHENKGVVVMVPSKGVMINKCLKRDLIECETEWSKTWPVNLRGYRTTVVGNIYENPELLELKK